MSESMRRARRGAVALAIPLLVWLGATAMRGAAEEPVPRSGHARALSLVLDRMFREPGGVRQDAESRARAGASNARVWRVRAMEGRGDRYDVIFYIGDRPACVWRVDLSPVGVFPDGCTLELWEEPRA